MKVIILIFALISIILTIVAGQGVPYGTCYNKTLDQMLMNSKAMHPQEVTLRVGIPYNTFWNFLVQAQYWVWWNPLFKTMYTTNFTLCGRMHAEWAALPKFPYPLNMSNSYHHIIQMGQNSAGNAASFAWFFAADSNEGDMYGRHTYSLQDAGDGSSLFGSFEKIAGRLVDVYTVPFTVALQESLLQGITGVICLERVYQTTGSLNPDTAFAMCNRFTP